MWKKNSMTLSGASSALSLLMRSVGCRVEGRWQPETGQETAWIKVSEGR